jgi:hypothetical protein
MVRTLAVVFGIIFVLVGLMGFVPALSPQQSDGMRYLLGLFMVGGVHNVIHLASGIAALLGGLTSAKFSKLYFQIFGPVYGIVTIIGFIQGHTVLGLFHVNLADNFLHLGLAVAISAIGYGLASGTTTQAPPTIVAPAV